MAASYTSAPSGEIAQRARRLRPIHPWRWPFRRPQGLHPKEAAMLRYILVLLFGVMTLAVIGCDDDDIELETPSGDVGIDVD
jgi:hypothetical protein